MSAINNGTGTGAESLILQHIIRLCLDANFTQLAAFGILPEDVADLLQLSAREQRELETRLKSCLQVTLNREQFDTAMRIARARAADEDLQDALIRAGASGTMLRQLFGTSESETVRRRKVLGVPGAGGRPASGQIPDIEFMNLWRSTAHLELPRQLLRLSEITGVSACAVWSVARELGYLDHVVRERTP